MEEEQHHQRSVGRRRYNLREPVIRYAMANTMSCSEAARFLNVSYPTFKHYAQLYIDTETGQSLFELHKNPTALGIKKSNRNNKAIERLVAGEDISMSATRVREELIHSGLIAECCSNCAFAERRITDGKVPLMLDWIDGSRSNNNLSNLRLLCFNCYFILVGNLVGRKDAIYDLDTSQPDQDLSMVDIPETVWTQRV